MSIYTYIHARTSILKNHSFSQYYSPKHKVVPITGGTRCLPHRWMGKEIQAMKRYRM